jgi:hypothetical protein
LLLSSSVGFIVSRGIIEQQMRRYLHALAEMQAQQVAREVERHHLFLRGIAASDGALFNTILATAADVQNGQRRAHSASAVQAHLVHELREIGSLTELFVIDVQGTLVASTDGGALGQDWCLFSVWLCRYATTCRN